MGGDRLAEIELQGGKREAKTSEKMSESFKVTSQSVKSKNQLSRVQYTYIIMMKNATVRCVRTAAKGTSKITNGTRKASKGN